jgi:hypothetical protein
MKWKKKKESEKNYKFLFKGEKKSKKEPSETFVKTYFFIYLKKIL